ncbi:hypothetical protein V8F20_003927 [Naviculisporaceae sp. PSN 640]
MAYHRQFLEAREERRQAQYEAIGEQIFANGINWLRLPGQRRTDRRRSSVYRVPTPHPSFRRRMGEPENEEDIESWDDQEEDDCYKDDELSPLSTEPEYSPRAPVQVHRRGGRTSRLSLDRRESAVPVGSVEPQRRDELTPSYENHEQEDEHSEEPTPAQEIQAIVRNVHQRRQVVVIQPSFPFPNYSAGEIVDGGNNGTSGTRPFVTNMPANQTSTFVARTATQPNAALHYLNRPQRTYSSEANNTDTPSTSSYPFPPGYSSQDDQPPALSLPPPALDLFSANLTGSLAPHPGLSPSGLFPSSLPAEGRRDPNAEEVILVEHIEDISQDRSAEEVILVEHVEDISQDAGAWGNAETVISVEHAEDISQEARAPAMRDHVRYGHTEDPAIVVEHIEDVSLEGWSRGSGYVRREEPVIVVEHIEDIAQEARPRGVGEYFRREDPVITVEHVEDIRYSRLEGEAGTRGPLVDGLSSVLFTLAGGLLSSWFDIAGSPSVEPGGAVRGWDD